MLGERTKRLGCVAGAADEGERLDRFLPAALDAQHGHALSRRAARRALQAGAVYVNGKRVRVASRPLRRGDRVEIELELSGVGELRPAPTQSLPAPRIVYEDPDLLVIDKASGVPSQATRTDALGNALEQVRAHLRERDGGEPYLALPHRLDRGTSGALILIKAKRANAGMARAFRHGAVEKVYRLWVALESEPPGPDGRRVEHALAADGRRMEIDPLGKEAVTDVTLLRRIDGPTGAYALLEARPRTGRKHQIRAHAAAEGWPILGDRLYSWAPFDQAAPRPMLHAHGLRFEHPVHHETVRVECPEPEDFRAVAEKLELP